MHAGRISVSWSEFLPHYLECQNHNKYLTSMYYEPFNTNPLSHEWEINSRGSAEFTDKPTTIYLEHQYQRRLSCGTNGKYKWFPLSERQFFLTYLHSITSLWQVLFLSLIFPHYPAVGIWWALHWKLLEIL